MNPVRLIRFGCAIRLSEKGRFGCLEDYRRDPEVFLTRWITGSVGDIFTGQNPIVKVRHWPNKNEPDIPLPPAGVELMRKVMHQQRQIEAWREYSKRLFTKENYDRL